MHTSNIYLVGKCSVIYGTRKNYLTIMATVLILNNFNMPALSQTSLTFLCNPFLQYFPPKAHYSAVLFRLAF